MSWRIYFSFLIVAVLSFIFFSNAPLGQADTTVQTYSNEEKHCIDMICSPWPISNCYEQCKTWQTYHCAGGNDYIVKSHRQPGVDGDTTNSCPANSVCEMIPNTDKNDTVSDGDGIKCINKSTPDPQTPPPSKPVCPVGEVVGSERASQMGYSDKADWLFSNVAGSSCFSYGYWSAASHYAPSNGIGECCIKAPAGGTTPTPTPPAGVIDCPAVQNDGTWACQDTCNTSGGWELSKKNGQPKYQCSQGQQCCVKWTGIPITTGSPSNGGGNTGGTPIPTPTEPTEAGYCGDSIPTFGTLIPVKNATCVTSSAQVSNLTWRERADTKSVGGYDKYCDRRSGQQQVYFYACAPGTGGANPTSTPGTSTPGGTTTTPPATTLAPGQTQTAACQLNGGVDTNAPGTTGGFINSYCYKEMWTEAKARSGVFCNATYQDAYRCKDGTIDYFAVPIAAQNYNGKSTCSQTPWCLQNQPTPTPACQSLGASCGPSAQCCSGQNLTCSASTCQYGTGGAPATTPTPQDLGWQADCPNNDVGSPTLVTNECVVGNACPAGYTQHPLGVGGTHGDRACSQFLGLGNTGAVCCVKPAGSASTPAPTANPTAAPTTSPSASVQDEPGCPSADGKNVCKSASCTSYSGLRQNTGIGANAACVDAQLGSYCCRQI